MFDAAAGIRIGIAHIEIRFDRTDLLKTTVQHVNAPTFALDRRIKAAVAAIVKRAVASAQLKNAQNPPARVHFVYGFPIGLPCVQILVVPRDRCHRKTAGSGNRHKG